MDEDEHQSGLAACWNTLSTGMHSESTSDRQSWQGKMLVAVNGSRVRCRKRRDYWIDGMSEHGVILIVVHRLV